MNKYLTKIASMEKEAADPKAIMEAIARKTLGKPKGWKLADMKDAELRFRGPELQQAYKDLGQKFSASGSIKSQPKFAKNVGGMDKQIAQATSPEDLVKRTQAQRGRNMIDYLRRTQPRRPVLPTAPTAESGIPKLTNPIQNF